jgi:hypothetical protein
MEMLDLPVDIFSRVQAREILRDVIDEVRRSIDIMPTETPESGLYELVAQKMTALRLSTHLVGALKKQRNRFGRFAEWGRHDTNRKCWCVDGG